VETVQALATLAANPGYRVLHRLAVADEQVFAENVTGESCARLAVIDTETTGLKPDLEARIIDWAIATCEYGLTSGTLYRVVDRYESGTLMLALELYAKTRVRSPPSTNTGLHSFHRRSIPISISSGAIRPGRIR
jgi:DNA polymerase III epsilon subunit-like protein